MNLNQEQGGLYYARINKGQHLFCSDSTGAG